MKFAKNEVFHTLRMMGIRTDTDKDGNVKGTGYVLSENAGPHGAVSPEMDMVFKEKLGGAPIFTIVLPTGETLDVRSHANHLNPMTGYNLLKGAPKGERVAIVAGATKAPSERLMEYRKAQVEKARLELAKQEGILAGLLDQAEKAPMRNPEAAKLKAVMSPESEARKEARRAIDELRAEAEKARSEVMENTESADAVIDAILAGETEDTTAPEATA